MIFDISVFVRTFFCMNQSELIFSILVLAWPLTSYLCWALTVCVFVSSHRVCRLHLSNFNKTSVLFTVFLSNCFCFPVSTCSCWLLQIFFVCSELLKTSESGVRAPRVALSSLVLLHQRARRVGNRPAQVGGRREPNSMQTNGSCRWTMQLLVNGSPAVFEWRPEVSFI